MASLHFARSFGQVLLITVFGLVVCSTTTISAFGVLAHSQIPVLWALGMTTALGSLAFAAILAEPPDKAPLLSATSPK
jgi:predicted exporter